MEHIPEDIIQKILKLLNLKEGAEAIDSMAEAENAASKLQALLMKYNLDLDSVKNQKIKEKSGVEEVHFDLSDKAEKRESFWVTRLYIAVARNNMCKIWSNGKEWVHIIGHSMNIALVSYICEQLIAKIRIAEKSTWSRYKGEEKRGTFRRGFLQGAAYGIDARLTRDYNEMKAGTSAEYNPYALMIRSKMKDIDEYLEIKYPTPPPLTPEQLEELKNQKPIKYKKEKPRKGPRQLSSNDGWHMGHEAGQKMNIDKGVSDNEDRTQIH